MGFGRRGDDVLLLAFGVLVGGMVRGFWAMDPGLTKIFGGSLFGRRGYCFSVSMGPGLTNIFGGSVFGRRG